TLNLLKSEFTPFFPAGAKKFNLCTVTDANLELGLGLQAKAWIGKWSFSKSFTIDALQGTKRYPKFPIALPAGCDVPDSPTTRLGKGVTKWNESNTGAAAQWDYVDGFVPGTKTWALSTGNVADAIGAPGQLASTDLGGGGDAALSALSGYPTQDAAS